MGSTQDLGRADTTPWESLISSLWGPIRCSGLFLHTYMCFLLKLELLELVYVGVLVSQLYLTLL